MPVSDPPADLTSFPSLVVGPGQVFFRLFSLVDEDGSVREPWYFSAAEQGSLPGAGPSRFDLEAPEGTCYASDQRYGAWVEVFWETAQVARADVERRRFLIAERDGSNLLDFADLASPRAFDAHVTLDLSTGDDYTGPQTWARAFRSAGRDGLRAVIRHDPSASAFNIALFGPAGAYSQVEGWRQQEVDVLDDFALWSELSLFGISVVPVPYEVPTVPPAT